MGGIGSIGRVMAVGLLVAGAAASSAPAARVEPAAAAAPPAGRLAGYNVERNAYFGDLHVHTYLSNDAYISNVRRTPDDAYRFAQGEPIGHASGHTIRLQGGPLDFAAVTDHSEYLSAVREAVKPGSPMRDLPIVQSMLGTDAAGMQRGFDAFVEGRRSGGLPAQFNDPAMISGAWREIQQAAARHNQPGRFTTLIGYEFTSSPDGKNMHRNVIFRSARVPGAPFAASTSMDPEDLWRTMDGWRSQGIEALAIPHNSNGSDGAMFDRARLNGQPIDRVYAELRARNEPLVEISQIKGTSETHPLLSPNDEQASFEIMERYIGTDKPVTKFQGGYVRRGLQDGLAMREALGVNGFKLGFISSTDTHNAAPGSSEEPNYHGASGGRDGVPGVRGSIPRQGLKSWAEDTSAPVIRQTRGGSGLAGVWAEENSREAIYAALRRKETFATSGPRIRVRFFAGDYPADLAGRGDAVKVAYARGVPMGGDLLAARGKAPRFLVWAVRDPSSGYLQRAQVVKGWIENGQPRERVFDVACSDGLKPDAAWKCPPNGAAVNMATCEPDRFKGDVELRTVWTDPGYDPRQRAFYYVRVLENPSCRWSTWDALRNGTPPSPRLPATVMERAWSSPIWVEPAA